VYEVFWDKVKNRLNSSGDKLAGDVHGGFEANGIVIFNVLEDAIKAEKIVKGNGLECKLVAPPPALRKGCDLAVAINLVEKPLLERILSDAVPYVHILPLEGSRELLQIVKVQYYEKHIMVKAANMKITYDKQSGRIVNTSGGGCPDIPYLHLQFLGKKLTEVPYPKDISYTLCALMLDRALEECISLWKREEIECCS
jgi:hypothetical protein